jgi:ribosomal protein S18 acetylase RimI-like enzyme
MLTITQGYKPEYVDRIHELETACFSRVYRQQGFGKLLMDEAEASLQKVGVRKMRLEVQVDNPAQVLYFKLGYRVTGVKNNYYSNGTTGVSMVKPLKRRSF